MLHSEFIKFQISEEDWLANSRQYEFTWNFPHCVAAIDGNHVIMQAPCNSRLTFNNYKHTHYIVLLAMCDVYYRFIMVDLGDAGCHSDGGVLANSSFGKALHKTLALPPSQPLPATSSPAVPFVIIGDEAFPLKPNMMRPHPGKGLSEVQRVYDYRLSRARRVIENAFGILAARWRIFSRPTIAHPDNVVS